MKTTFFATCFRPLALVLSGLSLAAMSHSSVTAAEPAADGAQYLQAVQRFADVVLREGRDTLGPKQTPLFLDGLEVQTRQPIRWPAKKETWVLANLASQQNLLRVLVGLSALTGEPKYRQAATDATRFGLEELRSETGLLYWGGHTSYDALGDKMVTEAGQHELKRHYPFYELMWQVDAEKTRRFVEAFWNAHILDWSNLDFNRHGAYKTPLGKVWDNDYRGGPVFFPSRGLTFVNTGSDLFRAGAMLHKFTGQPGPQVWAKRLAHRYVETRHPKTGLGGYVFSCYGPGDRAMLQFGPEFGDRVKEGTLLDSLRAPTKFAHVTLCQLMIGEMLGKEGREFMQWGLDDLKALGRHAYDRGNNTILPMITDGTRLTTQDVKRSGYYSAPCFVPLPADPRFLRAYALAWRLTGDRFCWEMIRSIAKGNGLGDLSAEPGGKPAINMETSCADADALHALLELHQKSKHPGYLRLACKVGDNILARRVSNDLFVEGKEFRFTRLDRREPLALLHLVAVLRKQSGVVPADWGGEPNFGCTYGNAGRKYDSDVIYSERRRP